MKKLICLFVLSVVLVGCGAKKDNVVDGRQDSQQSSVQEVKEEEVYEEYSKGGITFKVPYNYELNDNGKDIIFRNIDDSINIYIGLFGDEALPDEDFYKNSSYYDKSFDDKMGNMLVDAQRTKALDSEIAGFAARSYCYKGNYKGDDIRVYYNVINDTETNQYIGVQIIALETMVDEAERILNYMIETAQFTGASDFDKKLGEETEDNLKNATVEGVDPDLVAFLTEYEKFVDEYVEFMTKYSENPTDLELVSQYADVMQQYLEFSEVIEKYDSDSMSAEDASYYLDVTTRCSKKMLAVVAVN